MNSIQYEELCRYFLADSLGVEVGDIQSVLIPNPRRPGLPDYKHQIDLYWETEDDLTLYLNIANAKWRSSDKVEQGEVLLLQQVKQKTSAHKAFMLTSTGFTSGAEAAARDEGIGLHVVRPTLASLSLPEKDRGRIQEAFANSAATTPEAIYTHQIVHKAYDFGGYKIVTAQLAGQSGDSTDYSSPGRSSFSTKVMTGYSTKVATPSSYRSPSGGGLSGGGVGGSRGSVAGRGVVTKSVGPGGRK